MNTIQREVDKEKVWNTLFGIVNILELKQTRGILSLLTYRSETRRDTAKPRLPTQATEMKEE